MLASACVLVNSMIVPEVPCVHLLVLVALPPVLEVSQFLLSDSIPYFEVSNVR